MECIKCGSCDINVTYKSSEDKVYYENDYKKVANLSKYTKYISWQSQGYTSYSIQKEHLLCNCKTCQYKWAENTKDLKNRE